MMLSFLQREDPHISRIIFVSTYTAVYETPIANSLGLTPQLSNASSILSSHNNLQNNLEQPYSRPLFNANASMISCTSESGDMRKLEPEGSLYLVERTVKPSFKLILLNRKPNNDLVDYLTEDTEFVE